MTFFSQSSVFERLSSAETESSSRKRTTLSSVLGKSNTNGHSHSAYGNYNTSSSPIPGYISSNTSRSRSRSRTASSSLFNRLANTETYATASMKGKIPSPPRQREHNHHPRSPPPQSSSTSSQFWHRLAYTETFSTAQYKGKNDDSYQNGDRKSNSGPKSKTSNSFFDRMANTETFSTACRKGLVDSSPPKTTSKKTTSSFFDRMSRTDTYATASSKAIYDYGKSPETPSNARHYTGGQRTSLDGRRVTSNRSLDVFDRLARTDTRASSLKKSSSWQKRQATGGRFTPRTKTTSLYRKYYVERNRAQTPDLGSVRSARSERSTRSVRSARSIRSNIVDYVSKSRTTSNSNAGSTPSFVSRLSQPKTKPERQASPVRNLRAAVSSPTSSISRRPRESTVANRTTAAERIRKENTQRRAEQQRQEREKRQRELQAQKAAASRAASTAAAPYQSKSRSTSSPTFGNSSVSMFTSTTGSLSSFQSSKASRSHKQRSTTTNAPTATRSTARSTMAAKPKPQPKPKPAPRPVLQFDSEDDLSFGDDSEEEEELDLGGGKAEEEEKKKDDVPTETNEKAQGEEEEKKEVEDVLSGFDAAAITGDFDKVAVPAPQDDLSKDIGRTDDFGAEDDLDNYENGANFDQNVVETTEENNGNDSIEVVLQQERSTVPEESVDINNDNDLEEEFSIDTASIDDILGKPEDEEEVEEKDTPDNANGYDSNDPEEFLEEDNDEYINHYNDAPENETLTVSDQEDEDDFTDEPDEPYQAETDDFIDLDSARGNSAVDDFEQHNNTNDDDFADHDELDDVLNEEHETAEIDHALNEEHKTTEPDHVPNEERETDGLDEPNEPDEDENDNQESHRAPPNTFIESDDDISMGEDSTVDEETPEEITHKSVEEGSQCKDTPQQELPEEPHEEELVEEELVEEELPEDQSQEQQLPGEDSLHDMEFEHKEQMKESNTLDSLDFILDASSTIAEEPEEEEEEGQNDDEHDEDEEELSLFADDESYMEDDRSHSEHEEEHEMHEESEFEDDVEPGMEEEANEELPLLRYKLLISDKYHPEYGLEELYPEDLYLIDSLAAFEEGAISNQELAVLIIEALFERDFENGEHWEIDNGTARDLEEDEGGGGDLEGCAFVVKRQARLDWNDLYSVAAAKGTIIISSEKDEIKVENYSYFVAG